MATSYDTKRVNVCVPYRGDEIDVEVLVQLKTSSWEEKHDEGRGEPMSEEIRIGYDIESECPDNEEFIEALEIVLNEDFPTE